MRAAVFLWLCLLGSSIAFMLGSVTGLPVEEGRLHERPLTRLAFGSCSKHDRPQPLWPHIADFHPDLWIWLGDVVYADTKHFPLFWAPSPLQTMKAKYDAQKTNPAYLNFSRATPIISTWDDHDYGINNGGAEYSEKEQSKQLFLDFFDEPATSARRTRNGVYGAYTFGPPDRRVKVILLDVRYNRDHPSNPDPDILGEEQWRWFEKELRESDAQINIIGSGIQILPRDKPIIEKWANFPRSFARLEKTLPLAKGAVVLLSGDVHYAEIFKTRPRCGDESRDYQGIYEITSSGMTHCLGDHFPLGFGRRAFTAVMTSKWRVSELFEHRNFGTIEIFWGEQGRATEVRAEIRNETGQVVLTQSIVLGAKSNDADRCISEAELQWYAQAQGTWMNWHSDVWINAINYAILASPLLVLLLAFYIYKRLRRSSVSTPGRPKRTAAASQAGQAKTKTTKDRPNEKKKSK